MPSLRRDKNTRKTDKMLTADYNLIKIKKIYIYYVDITMDKSSILWNTNSVWCVLVFLSRIDIIYSINK